MSKKLSIKNLIDLEKKHNLWKYKLFDYPLWIHCREPLINSEMEVSRKIYVPKVTDMIKSFYQTVIFLFQQKKYKKVYFLMERAELLEIYVQDKDKSKILFLNPEQEKTYKGKDYISSDFFNLLRFVSRKIAFVIFRKKYKEIIKYLYGIEEFGNLNTCIKNSLGDAFFLKVLSIILIKENKKYYSGSVIPIGEKFINLLNSYEVQHGVIHSAHVGYIGIPDVKNTLILYFKYYEKVMRNNNYRGKLLVQNYKNNFLKEKKKNNIPIVIYTQPTEKMYISINEFIQKHKPTNFFIQKHPKDYFHYDLEDRYFVNATTPNQVMYPIMYTSSIIENFIFCEKKCYIYDLKFDNFDLKDFLSIYTDDLASNTFISDSLENIYNKIMEDLDEKIEVKKKTCKK